MRLVGAPIGHELTSLADAILTVGSGDPGLTADSLARLATLSQPVHVQVFSTPTCVYCPRAVALAHRLAVASPLISATAYSVIEFPDLIRRHRVTGVPEDRRRHRRRAARGATRRRAGRRRPPRFDTNPMAAIDIAGVSKTFGSHVAVDDLSLSVDEGSIYGFIGPNGSGKTTTLRMIMNILLPDRGEIHVLGRSGSAAARDDVGYLPEERGPVPQDERRPAAPVLRRAQGRRRPPTSSAR